MKKIDHAAAAYRKSSIKPVLNEQGFLKTSIKKTEQETIPKDGLKSVQSGYLKAAKFLLLIGPDQAAEVLKQFSPDDVEKIVKEIVLVRKLKKKESAEILSDMGRLVPGSLVRPSADAVVTGGADKAMEMLLAAFGKEDGTRIFDKVLPFGGRRPFDFLDELQPEQILVILKNEPPYVMSIVLAFLQPVLSSKIISNLPPESRKEIILRIARQGKIAPGIIEKMEGIFRDRIRTQGKIITEKIDGKAVLADILKHMDFGAEEKILDEITSADEDLAAQIKDRIYTLNLLLQMNDQDIQYLLRDFGNSELAIIIKGKSEQMKSKLLTNISERRRIMVEEESVYLGEMRRADVDKATKELIDYLMELEQKGVVSVPRGKEEYI
ncbi:MAG: flagellar motor switch protein FliG [Spirochaetales bacterium]|nr:flagellar motor switch protein FliG [Spirochaetales bacterium]